MALHTAVAHVIALLEVIRSHTLNVIGTHMHELGPPFHTVKSVITQVAAVAM